MPELPEVETIKRIIEPALTGRVIEKAQTRLPRITELSKGAALKKLTGQQVENIRRAGKYLIFELKDYTIIFHLGMTGQLILSDNRTQRASIKPVGANSLNNTHIRFLIKFPQGSTLLFRDIRTFGRVIILKGRQWLQHPRLARLGPDPLQLSPANFKKRLLPVTSRRSIKAMLLDQAFLAGIGNIYADEALFNARLLPSKTACELKSDEWSKLYTCIRQVLNKGIRNMGTTFSDYRKPDGEGGSNQDYLLVYGKGGAPCSRCKTVLLKTVVAGRGTVHCPKCQR